MNDFNVLHNLQSLITSVDELISFDDHPQINLRAINLINLIAFKSSMEVRNMMKDLKLLEQRDLLILRHLYATFASLRDKQSITQSDIVMVSAVSSFSYETLASKPVFADNKGTEYLSLILLLVSECDDLTQAKLDLKSKLFDEVLQFDQNNSELIGQLKTCLSSSD